MTRPVTRTVSSQAASTPIPLNHQGRNPFNVTLLADLTGSATYSVQYTMDDVFDNAYNPANGVWNAVTNMSGLVADGAGSLSSPVTAVRLNVTTYGSGSVVLTVIQQT